MDSKTNLAHSYKIFMMTSMLEADIVMIKKINSLLEKYKSQDKISYMFETINIIKTLDNVTNLSNAKEEILSLVDDKDTIEFMIDNLDNLTIDKLKEVGIVSTN